MLYTQMPSLAILIHSHLSNFTLSTKGLYPLKKVCLLLKEHLCYVYY